MASVALSTRSPRQWTRMAVPAAALGVVLIVVASASPASAAGGPHSANVGLPPAAIAIDAAAHTAYVAVTDGVTDQVAVVDIAHCNGHAKSGCSAETTAVALEDGAGPAGLAFDAANHTVYVADSNTGDVSMINAATCNATTQSGCATAPKIAALGLTTPSAIAVDTSGGADVFYVADESAGTVTVVNGATCKATKATGCGTVKTATVGSAPSAIAVDPAVNTTYVANLGDDTISTLKESACSKLTSPCVKAGATAVLAAGASPVSLVADPAVQTLYVADSGTAAVSFLNTAKCNIVVKSGCAKKPRSQTGFTPAGLALSPAGNVAAADAADDAIIVVNDSGCNSATTAHCLPAEIDPLNGSPAAVAVNGASVFAADATNNSLDAIAVPTIKAKVTSAHHKTKFGWYRSPITVRFICTKGTAPLKKPCPAAVKLTKNGKHQSVSKTIASTDGGSATVTVSNLNLDQNKPTLKVTGVKNGKTYPKPPTLKCRAHDALSGLAAPCTIKRTRHGHVVDYVATARDKAGNVRTVHGKFRVA